MNVEQKESTKSQVDQFRKREVFHCLSQSNDLSVGSGCLRHSITSSRVYVNSVDTTLFANDGAKFNGDIASSRTNVYTSPTRTETETLEGGRQGAPIDIISQTSPLTVVRGHHHGLSLAH
jgi:hypothetical protein